MIYFAKYEHKGNTAVIVDRQDTGSRSGRMLSSVFTDSVTGVSADSLVILDVSEGIYSMVSYSRNGIRQPLNGNGLACLSHYMKENNYITDNSFIVHTDSCNIPVKITSEDPFTTRITLPPPLLSGDACCIQPSLYSEVMSVETSLGKIYVHPINTGTIHAVVWIESYNEWGLNRKGKHLIKENPHEFIKKAAPEISHNYIFKLRTSVDFATITDRNTISLNTYERGNGFISSCLTGSAAAAFCGARMRLSDNIVTSGNIPVEITPSGAVKLTCHTNKILDGFLQKSM